MLTKRRTLPWASSRRSPMPAYFLSSAARSSPRVAPSTSTVSRLSVKGRSGVGMETGMGIRIFDGINGIFWTGLTGFWGGGFRHELHEEHEVKCLIKNSVILSLSKDQFRLPFSEAQN